MFQTNTVPVSLNLDRRMFTGIEKRAGELNTRPSEYVRQLLEAAYAARIGFERGEESFDQDLDRQVRQVFLIAECEPEFIAATVGIPEDRVKRIIAAWRKAGPDIDRPRPAAPVLAPAPAAPVLLGGGRLGWSAEHVETTRRMWAEGKTAAEIGRAVGRQSGSVHMWSSKNRDICPKRRA